VANAVTRQKDRTAKTATAVRTMVAVRMESFALVHLRDALMARSCVEGIVFPRARCAVLRVTVTRARNVLRVDALLEARLVEAVVPLAVPLAVHPA
jgi:hypothetical protein